jgi:hypothetical protein
LLLKLQGSCIQAPLPVLHRHTTLLRLIGWLRGRIRPKAARCARSIAAAAVVHLVGNSCREHWQGQ